MFVNLYEEAKKYPAEQDKEYECPDCGMPMSQVMKYNCREQECPVYIEADTLVGYVRA
jgi:hypothetical protein